jgi:peptidoglycan/LPS O-acetylase OafA/YrhL
MQSLFNLRREQGGRFLTFAKGMAILLIFFHHFARSAWLSRGMATPSLMQWTFTSCRVDFGVLTSAFLAGKYFEVLLRLMAHFGYVGVHLFVLLSGLGLALGTAETIPAGIFLKRRVRKLVPPFWIAVIIFSVLDWVAGHPYSIGQIAERLFLFTTFDANRFFIIDSPLWCLAVFFQLYLLFLPLRRLIVRFGPLSLLPLALIGFLARLLASQPQIVKWNEYAGHTLAPNWLAVFGLGIWIGDKLRRNGEVALPAWAVAGTALISIPFFVFSELYTNAYPIHDTAIGLLMVVVAFLAWRLAVAIHAAHILSAVGAVSFPLYLYHRPIVTKAVNLWCRNYDPASPLFLCMGLALAVVLIVFLHVVKKSLRATPALAAWTLGE